MRRPKNKLPKIKKRDWKAGQKVYLPTAKQIAAACRRIQQHWANDDPRVSEPKRPVATPVLPVPLRFVEEAYREMRMELSSL